MRHSTRKVLASAVVAFGLCSHVPTASAVADGSAEFYSQSGENGWRVQLVCTTVNTQALDSIVYIYLSVSCGSFALDWGDMDFDDFDSEFDEISVQSGYKGPWSMWDGFSANG